MVSDNEYNSSKFSEDIYFMLMSPPMRTKVLNLASRHGLSLKELRREIVRRIDDFVGQIQDPS